eukprot:7388227-Prymnesium_polylepis.1
MEASTVEGVAKQRAQEGVLAPLIIVCLARRTAGDHARPLVLGVDQRRVEADLTVAVAYSADGD